MTKEQEDLYKWFDEELSCNFNKLVTKMNKFFSQNVCIPKGVNRHEYADVLHEWIEGATNIESYYNSTSGWVEAIPAIKICHLDYRIKPSEPVYEWQWLVINKHNNSVRDFLNYQNYMTVLEASNHYVSRLDTKIYNIVKIEETKRVRK